MKDKRSFLMGIGTGLIIAALLISVPGLFVKERVAGKTGPQIPDSVSRQPDLNPDSAAAPDMPALPEEDKADSDTVQVVEIEITRGMTADAIAGLLEREKIIKDKNSFLELIRRQGAANKLKSGKFSLKTNQTDDQVLAELLLGT
jgi:hypothetical protein